MTQAVIEAKDLRKTFRQGFWRKRVDAVNGVSFRVEEGSVFGFLGPNGAGKTTSIKILTGLIAPSAGQATLLGQAVPSPSSRKQLGFLPENPYVYPYLTPREFVAMCARLSGVASGAVAKRTHTVLERVGILYAADRSVGRLSKGMLQRTCLAAALVHEPKLLILDEPMSGLDPVGRKEVRDIILEERQNGRTVFFSSHILSDVESMCDEVTILRKGEVVVEGRMDELLQRKALATDIVLVGPAERCEALQKCFEGNDAVRCMVRNQRVRVAAQGDGAVALVLEKALEQGLRVAEVVPQRETLEDLFVKRAFEREGEPKDNAA